jgi:fatty acid desaturase
MLRHSADRRTLLWCAAMPVVALSMYVNPGLIPWMSPLACYLALSAGVIAHNHNHCPTFKNRSLNNAFGMWLSCFYGYPTFAWIPTHNLNHHKYVNKAGDATITWRYTNRHNFLIAFTYFFISSYFQADPTKAFIRKARTNNPTLYRQIVTQYVAWVGQHVLLLALGIFLYGLWGGVKVWLFAFAIPAVFALWTIIFFNYIQHVHTDPWSEHNHSRSWTGWAINFFLFNNGFHAAHHEMPGAHWSTLPEAHKRIEAEIHPDLKPRYFFPWCFATYVLGPIFPRFATKQIGRPPFSPPTGEKAEVQFADELEAVESGVNAARV